MYSSSSRGAEVRFFSVVVVDRFEQLGALVRRAGGEQLVDLVGVGEDDRDLAEDLQVTVVQARDADGEAHLVAVPVDRLVVAHHRDRRPLDRVLGLVRAVRDGEEVAHVRGHRLLALEHRVDVGGTDRARVDEDLPGLADRVVLAPRRAGHLDLGLGEDVTHGTPWKGRPAGTLCGCRPAGSGQRGDEAPSALVVFSSSTMASYWGLFMKLSTETCCADGDMVLARGVRSW